MGLATDDGLAAVLVRLDDRSADKKYDQSVQYAEKAAALFAERSTLKNVERANYRNVLNQLVNYYKGKKNEAKVKQYEDQLKTLGT